MKRNKLLLVLLGLSSVFLLLTTMLFGAAWADAASNAEELNSSLKQKKNTLESKVRTINSLQRNISDKNNQISSLETEKENLDSEVETLRDELDRPLLYTGSPTWYELDSGEHHFSFNVYNFGEDTAENVDADIRIFSESEDVPKKTVPVEIGNIAGSSAKNVEYSIDLDSAVNSEDLAGVKISSCAGCEILWKNIPAL